MANKKILVSSGNGKRQTVPTLSGTSSLYFDDATNTLVAKSGSIATLQVGDNSGIITAVNGVVTNVPVGSSGSVLFYNGSSWATGVASNPSGSAGGDLTGSYPSPQVKSLSNVTSGTLGVAYGGTNKTTLTSGAILTGSSAGIGTISTGQHNAVVKVSGSSWTIAGTRIIDVSAYFSAGSTWTKPEGARFIRVIIQGAGGGGSSGWLRNSTAQSVAGGGGGGSGGLTELIINVKDLADGATIPVYAGIGGAAGIRDVNNGATAGGDGERSAFGVSGALDTPTASNAKYFAQATGGKGGTNTNTVATGGAGGYGLKANGVAGGSLASAASTPTAGSNNNIGSAAGGAGGGVTTTTSGRNGATGGNAGAAYLTSSLAGGLAGLAASNTNATDGDPGNFSSQTSGFTSDIYYLSSGGAGGGASYGATPGWPGWGGNSFYGGGGGGGAAGYSNGSEGYYTAGGYGGDGYVVVISYG
jgi:hypothetical protein